MFNKSNLNRNKTMAQIGYIRVSSNSQNTDRQLDGVTLDKTFTEKQSGKSANDRLELQNCIDYTREGDTLHVHSIDRLARNLADLQALVARINSKGVAVQFHKENLTFTADGSSPMNNLMFQMLGAFAEFERSIIKERQREGIDKALEKGIKFGAKPKFSSEQIEQIKARHGAGVSVANIAKEFETSRQTIYTVLAKVN
jgi:DNA invertase Pin-like site-specific DNA recombinase